ncbi:MAG: UDP-N-acetylmuramoyl-L-alanyl-D-glutamate--2,6-diaminopimelate ligase, partial [Bacteroidaceae bacterium]|nr:UDP-N-acetylmuramoyl-L-alanyl-D-glutamate--2,6-diaminopimelate ligase [Bacteroidaceae bacterium]
MQLANVLNNIPTSAVCGDLQIPVTGVCIDSRRVKAGDLFIAVKGTQVDGHAYINKALENGAVAVLQSDALPTAPQAGVVYVQTTDTERYAGVAATNFYGEPSKKLKLVGVTGTNGKTTIATLLYQTFRAFGHKCGLCSTVCNYIDDVPVPADHTTPDAVTLNKLLAEMVEAGCEYAFMECSSHAIHQHRIGGLQFAGGIFTNLTRDHLDYHETFENYRDAKKAFFDGLSKEA